MDIFYIRFHGACNRFIQWYWRLDYGYEAIQQHFRVKFISLASLATQLIEAKDAHQLTAMLKRYTSVDLLIVDELGYTPLSKADAELVFRVRICMKTIADLHDRKVSLGESEVNHSDRFGSTFFRIDSPSRVNILA